MTTASSKKIILWIAAFLISLVVLGAVWFVHGFLDLAQHLSPTSSGSNMAPSTSMEPYPITLRVRAWDESGAQRQATDQIAEWALSVPRAFVKNIEGQDGSIRDDKPYAGYLQNGEYDVRAELKILDDNKTIVPLVSATHQSVAFDDNTIILDIKNSGNGNDAWITKNNLCVPMHLDKQMSEKYGGRRTGSSQCFPTIKYCGITTDIDGWYVYFNATKKLYNEPEKACALVKKFLNQYTVKRDVFPVK